MLELKATYLILSIIIISIIGQHYEFHQKLAATCHRLIEKRNIGITIRSSTIGFKKHMLQAIL
jgi:hypothetical protein